jgi:hypothetical protein
MSTLEPTEEDIKRIEVEGLHTSDVELVMCMLLVNIRDSLYRIETDMIERHRQQRESSNRA